MENNEEKENLLSEESVWSVLEFAMAANSLKGQVLTVDLINQRMKDVTLLQTGEVTEAQVTAALKAPKDSEQELLRISEAFEVSSSVYKRLLHYLSNMASFDLTYSCKNAKFEDYKSKAYQKDLEIVKEFLQKFDYKKEFSRAIRQMLRQEVYFTVFRDEGEKYTLQELPADRCKITGRWDYGDVLFSFDMLYFVQPGISIDMYPDSFKRHYNNLMEGNGVESYKPYLPVSQRTNSSWVYWVDLSPIDDNAWGFKFSSELATRYPYFSGLFPDLVLQGLIRGLQKNITMAAATRMIWGQVPLQKDAKTNVKDMITVSPQILGQFMALVKSSVNSEAVKIASAPLEEMKAFAFDSDNDVYSSYLKTTLGTSGVNSNLLFSADVKPNVQETLLSLAVDEMVVQYLYPMFSNFMDFQINRQTKKYKFAIKFEGSNFFTDRDRRLKNAMTLADKGIVLPQKIAAAQGMNPFEFQAQLDEARAMGFVDTLTPISVKGVSPVSNDGAGRPKKDDGELGEAGSQTRDDGGNLDPDKGGKI